MLTFSPAEIRKISNQFNEVKIQDNLAYFTSKDTDHKWIIQKSKLAPSTIIIHHKRNKDAYYHKHCTNAKSVNDAINRIKSHDRYEMSKGI